MGVAPAERGMLGDVHDTISGPRARVAQVGRKSRMTNVWLSLGRAVLATGVAQICLEGFSITAADTDSTTPRLADT